MQVTFLPSPTLSYTLSPLFLFLYPTVIPAAAATWFQQRSRSYLLCPTSANKATLAYLRIPRSFPPLSTRYLLVSLSQASQRLLKALRIPKHPIYLTHQPLSLPQLFANPTRPPTPYRRLHLRAVPTLRNKV